MINKLQTLFFAVILVIFLFALMLLRIAVPYSLKTVEVEVPQGLSSQAVQLLLEQDGLLPERSGFSFAARVLGISKTIKAGRYLFSPGQTMVAILWQMKNGQVVLPEQVSVTFPEGSSIYKMGEILTAAGVKEANKFPSLARDGIDEALRNRHWEIFKYIPSESLEGYLYPDTYLVFKTATIDELVEKLLPRFEQKVLPFWQKSKGKTRLSLHEILTLASIVEKEAKVASERPIIASVFYNRLKVGMPLAADPTIKYALEQPTKKVYLNQLEVDSPYNTYRRRGLPPGPICNPGIESIKAAVYPAKTNYFFFVAQKDGSHVFSKTWVEHQKARQRVATPTQ